MKAGGRARQTIRRTGGRSTGAGNRNSGKYGFAVTNYDNYAIAADFNQEEKGLDILAHLDVVPAGEGWQETDPFTPLIKEGKMFGRGTADDKGPAIAAIYAMRAVKELGYPLKKNVRLVLGSDEECGSSDLEYYYKKEVEAPCTFSPDAEFPVINIEKGGMRGHFEKHPMPERQACASYPYRPAPN